jgi:hypothetical protein
MDVAWKVSCEQELILSQTGSKMECLVSQVRLEQIWKNVEKKMSEENDKNNINQCSLDEP